MSSILPDFSYDIFISYRQKDNKYDGWVTRFVENLKRELEATFKEDVSIYFDINLQDGLLESHEVADSLKMKLKCLIFIPVISQTYCDPKSFAWEHEFKDFIEIAAKDQFGLKIKLHNGNIASRVLPVRIHDLKPEDIKLFESVSGGNLRGIEFIYKSLGVNRPLRENEDHAQDNLNKTYYRDQINKAAHAINDIITALKLRLLGITDEISVTVQDPPVHNLKLKKRRTLRISRPIKLGILSFTLIILLVFSLKWMTRRTSEEILDKVISYYDLYNRWGDYYGKIHLITLFASNNFSEEIIEIQTKENYYKWITYSGNDTIIQGIKNGKYFGEINGNSSPDENLIKTYNLDSININTIKEHHYWHFGGVMFLKSAGLDLEKKVGRAKFQGHKCLFLTFSSDSSKIKSTYLKSTKWNVYVDPDNYTILGYRIHGVWNIKDGFITCQGELDHNGIKMPLIKIYFSSLNNSIQLVDMFHKIE